MPRCWQGPFGVATGLPHAEHSWFQPTPTDSPWGKEGQNTAGSQGQGEESERQERQQTPRSPKTEVLHGAQTDAHCGLWKAHISAGENCEREELSERNCCVLTLPSLEATACCLGQTVVKSGAKKKCWAWEEGVTWTEAVLAFVFFSQHLTLFLISDTLNLSNLFCLRQ